MDLQKLYFNGYIDLKDYVIYRLDSLELLTNSICKN